MSTVTFTPAMAERLAELLGLFKLPTMAAETTRRLEKSGHAAALALLLEVAEMEAGDRRERRIDRLRRSSMLPPGKTLDAFDLARLPRGIASKIQELKTGAFLDRATNVLAFGLPGTGKTHFACALGNALVQDGRSVLFIPTYELVQTLLVAKRNLELTKALRRFDTFELLILDDIGYVQQSPDEAEVLFTLMAERYERRSLLITSNLVFGQWERIFKNPMTTAAAIDRLVHHSVILEFDVVSFRTEQAQLAQKQNGDTKKKSKNENLKTPEATT
ncbi:MAG TPA: IS21-like element helper ATPase IstB [Gemmatimonadaceae bacterium]|jgi:DNA replication protein DnaC